MKTGYELLAEENTRLKKQVAQLKRLNAIVEVVYEGSYRDELPLLEVEKKPLSKIGGFYYGGIPFMITKSDDNEYIITSLGNFKSWVCMSNRPYALTIKDVLSLPLGLAADSELNIVYESAEELLADEYCDDYIG